MKQLFGTDIDIRNASKFTQRICLLSSLERWMSDVPMLSETKFYGYHHENFCNVYLNVGYLEKSPYHYEAKFTLMDIIAKNFKSNLLIKGNVPDFFVPLMFFTTYDIRRFADYSEALSSIRADEIGYEYFNDCFVGLVSEEIY